MLFLFLLSTINEILVLSPLRTDCYKSFSDPIIYLKISHYFPSGPFGFHALVSYNRYSYLPDKTLQYSSFSLDFKKIEHECTPTNIFTTLGKDFLQLNVLIQLALINSKNIFATIYYTFYRGFKPGLYKMFDSNQNFIIHEYILGYQENIFIHPKKLSEVAKSYVISISGENNEICIITENNHAVILKPIYDNNATHGYINQFGADIYRFGKLFGNIDYSAFECSKNKSYPQDEVILITEDERYYSLYLYVKNIFSKKKKFTLYSPKFYSITNFEHIPNGYKQIFLMERNYYYPNCRLKIYTKAFYSRYNITYYANVHKNVHISTYVKFNANFYRSSSNMCD